DAHLLAVREMDEVDVASHEVPARHRAALGADSEAVREIHPKSAAFDGNVLCRLGILAIDGRALHGDAVIVGMQEAIADRHITGIARVDLVIVAAPRAADAEVA